MTAHTHSRAGGRSHGDAATAPWVGSRAGRRFDSPALIGLGSTLVILRITWQSWRTVRGGARHHDHHEHDHEGGAPHAGQHRH